MAEVGEKLGDEDVDGRAKDVKALTTAPPKKNEIVKLIQF